MECRKCGHDWKYAGHSEFYVTCPHCYTKVKVEDKKK
jgi:ribosomal protein S27E